MRHHLTRLALVTVMSSCIVATATLPAHASLPTPNDNVLDTDPVTLTGTGATLTATITAMDIVDGVRGYAHGTVARTSTGPACVFTRTTWAYADGGSTTLDSPRACAGEYASRAIDLHSDYQRDYTRVTVELRGAVDSVSAGAALSTATYFVGDTPDSLGTAARIDRDIFQLTKSSTIVATGQVDWAIAKNPASSIAGPVRSTQGTLSGRLQWSDALPGTTATLQVTWSYFDGSTQTSKVASVSRGGAPVSFTATSNIFKEAKSASASVVSESGSTSLGTQASAPALRLGDYYGS